MDACRNQLGCGLEVSRAKSLEVRERKRPLALPNLLFCHVHSSLLFWKDDRLVSSFLGLGGQFLLCVWGEIVGCS